MVEKGAQLQVPGMSLKMRKPLTENMKKGRAQAMCRARREQLDRNSSGCRKPAMSENEKEEASVTRRETWCRATREVTG